MSISGRLAIIILMSMTAPAMIVCAGEWPTTVPAASLHPVPDVSEQVRASRLVEEVHRTYAASRDTAARRELAMRLLKEGLATKDDLAVRFVLLREARDVAADAGEAILACRAIEHLEQQYRIDGLQMRLATLSTAMQRARQPNQLAGITRMATNAAERAIQADDHPMARRFAEQASSAATRAGDTPLQQRVRDLRDWIDGCASEYEQVRSARTTLSRGEDPLASAILGRYLCLNKGDFATGLPLIVKRADSSLAKCAQLENAAGNDAGKLALAANAWWDAAQQLTGPPQRNVHAHAADLYRKSAGQLSGFALSLARERFSAIESEQIRSKGLEPGLAAALFRGSTFGQRARSRVDRTIDFDWGQQSADESLGKDNFSIRWTGFIHVTSAGSYELTLIANTGCRVWIDERLILDGPDLSRRRSGMKTSIDLPSGLHAIRIDYWDTTGLARVRLLWRQPGMTEAQPIPASNLFHDPLVGGE